MANEQLIVSAEKAAKESPWRLTLLLGAGVNTTVTLRMNEIEGAQSAYIQESGTAAPGPKLKKVLKEMEDDGGYPISSLLYSLKKEERYITVSMTNNRVTYVEASTRTLSALKGNKKVRSGVFRETLDVEGWGEQFKAQGLSPTQLVAEVVEVLDGDTVKVRVLTLPENLIEKQVGNYLIAENEVFPVRLIGLDSMETRKEGPAEAYAVQQNRMSAELMGIPLSLTWDIAREAKEKTTELLKPGTSNAIVLIQLQHKDGSNEPLSDSGAGRRPLGVLYHVKGLDKTLDMVGIDDGGAENLNKRLLGLRFSQDITIPLFEHDRYNIGNGNDLAINVSQWASEVGWKPKVNKVTEEDRTTVAMPSTSQKMFGEHTYAIRYEEEASNGLDFIKPLDDRIESQELYSVSMPLDESEDALEVPLDYYTKVRIGDVMLSVPPLSIRTSRLSSIERVKTLRTQTSMMKGVGSAETVLTMELYFNGMDDINGHRRKGYTEKDGTEVDYFMDGLRPLMAQFKKVPFVPIDNHYINDTLGIQNVALMNLSVETVEGFPESLKAVITLMKFEPEAYMIEEPSLASLINYPLMRWYYQKNLRAPGAKGIPGQTHLLEIEELNHQVRFALADEQELMVRQDAIRRLAVMDTPEQVREAKNEDKTSDLGRREEDAKRAEKVLRQFEEFVQYEKANKNKTSARLNTGTMDILYGTSFPGWSGGLQNSSFIPKGLLDTHFRDVLERAIDDIGSSGFKTLWANVEDKAEGLFVLAFGDSENVGRFPTSLIAEKDGLTYERKDGTTYMLIPSTPNWRVILEDIADDRKTIEQELQEYEDEYEAYVRIAESSEEDLKMLEYDLSELICTKLQVIYENQFSKMQMQKLDSPTLQYMGGQDPYIYMTFETNGEGIKSFNDMLLIIERYNREYRQGINAGFMGIENSLLSLFGVKSVMPENIDIQSIPGFPDRFIINSVFCGFNKTQRRMERLLGISSGLEKDTVKDRRFSRYSQDKDFAVLEYRMKNMEVYPDLELPTYDELNEVLPQLEAGFDTFPNRTDQYFVDPDFYISSQRTLRDELKKIIEKDTVELVTYDNTGMSATSGMGRDGFIDAENQEFKTAFDQLDESVESVPSDFKWENKQDMDTNATSEDNTAGVDTSMTKPNLSEKMKELIKLDEKGEAPYQTIPSYKEWKSFTGNRGKSEAAYNYWKNNPKARMADENEVWLYLMQTIVRFWGDQLLMQDSDRQAISGGSVKEKGGYHHSANFFKANFMEAEKWAGSFYDRMDRQKGYVKANEFEMLENIKGASGEHVEAVFKLVTWSKKSDIFQNKVGVHRIGAFMKAVMMQHSRWQSVDGPRPVLSQGWRAGIMGYPLDIVNDETTAKRLLWDWKYNIQASVGLMFQHWTKAINSKELRFMARSEQWMLWAYGCPGQDKLEFPFGEKSTAERRIVPSTLVPGAGYVNTVLKIAERNYLTAEKDGNIPIGLVAGGQKPVLPRILAYYSGVQGEVKRAFEGDREAIVNLMTDDLFYPLSAFKWEKGGNEIKPKYGKTEMSGIQQKERQRLRNMEREMLEQTFLNHIGELNKALDEADDGDIGSFMSKVWDTVKFNGWYDLIFYNARVLFQGFIGAFKIAGDGLGFFNDPRGIGQSSKLLESDMVGDRLQKMTELAKESRMMNTADPDEIQRGMYTDMLEYDMQGRMVRAFPAFQMFIVDEGKWLANYRMWDNMYGFNAIESIDVNRSRKIAADTAVIKMTNMYSNLTNRRTDAVYEKLQIAPLFSQTTWSQYILGKPSEEYMEERSKLYRSMFLQPGARVHLRIGYGANVLRLPVVFNGTIAEMDTGEIVTIVCQGDGVELTNTISGDPDDENKGFLNVKEPSETLGKLMSSKGNWMKDMISGTTEGQFFKDNPLGIAHFGGTIEAPSGNYVMFNSEYGEVAQNIYSQNGIGTFSQWKNEKNENLNLWSVMTNYGEYGDTGFFDLLQPGDEDNIIVKFYNNTVWDIFQTFAYCSSDYIAAVMPYEMRSTVFFGKPYWPVAYKYDSTYQYDEAVGEWTRKLDLEHRKPYMQAHLYNSNHNIIRNDIKASEDGVYTNVIVTYDGNVTPVLQADNDIRLDKQKTVALEAQIVGRFGADPTGSLEYWTSESQASKYGHSAVRDYMKDMYKGQLIVLGDPTVKPHDIFNMHDDMVDMTGNALVKSVTHHFSLETGFVTSIEPDAYVYNWDPQMAYHSSMVGGFGRAMFATTAGMGAAYLSKKMVTRSAVYKKISEFGGKHFEKYKDFANKNHIDNAVKQMVGGSGFDKKVKETARKISKTTNKKELKKLYEEMAEHITKAEERLGKAKDANDIKRIAKTKTELKKMKNLVRASKYGAKANTIMKGSVSLVRGVTSLNPIGLLLTAAFTVGTESLFEMWRRKKQDTQCVVIMPLQYRGREFTAGINGHRGAVYGDEPSAMDRFLEATFEDDLEDWKEYGSALINFMAGEGKRRE